MATSVTHRHLLGLARWASVVVFVLGSALALRFGDPLNDLTALPYLAYFVIGLVLSLRRPANPIGWLFLAIGVITGVNGGLSAVTLAARGTGYQGAWYVLLAAWAYNFMWLLLLSTSVIFTLLLFPDGLPSRRWRPVFWAAVASTAVGAVLAALAPDLTVGDPDSPRGAATYANPLHPDGWDRLGDGLFNISVLVLAGCGVLAVVAAVLRFHRATGIERAQMKWLALAAVLFALTLVTSGMLLGSDGWMPAITFAVAASLIPLACGLAILRYRLYDIDRIISRTASYAIVTSVLVATYALIVTSVTRLLPDSSTLAVAAATLAAAASARPLYRRIQHGVDRRFNRARYDAERTVDSFGMRLRHEIHPESVQGELLAAVSGTLQPATVRLWRP